MSIEFQTTGSHAAQFLTNFLVTLKIGGNGLSGTLLLINIPQKMWFLSVSSNQFSGDFCLKNPPYTLLSLTAENNKFNPIAVVAKSTFATLSGSGVTSVRDAEGNIHDKEWLMLSLGRSRGR